MIYEEGFFTGVDGLELYTQWWRPEAQPRANLAVVHGLGEYSDRYSDFAAWFAARGYAVHAFDHRGHGRSPGQRGHVERWSDFRGDVRAFLSVVGERLPDPPVFLVGHSMGALISLNYALHEPAGLRGVVASGPPLDWGEDVSPALVAASRLLARVAPRAQMSSGLNPEGLSRDAEVVWAYREDPLVHGWATPRFGVELEHTMRWTMSHADEWAAELPLLILHGGADPICPAQASDRFYANVGAQDKTRLVYPGFLHEVYNEVGRERVLQDVATWFDTHLPPEV